MKKIKKIWHSRWFVPIYVAVILIIFVSLSLLGSAHDSVTNDEVAHIPAGISYVKTHDIRLNPIHPPFIKYLSGLSAEVFTNPKINTSSQSWKDADDWSFGSETFYKTSQNKPDKIAFWGRLPVLILSVGLGLIIFLWARSMFGNIASLAALTLFALDPTMIAYSHLVTFDLPMATFITASAYCLWLGLKYEHIRWYILSGVSLGLALTSKATALAYFGLIPLLLVPKALKSNGSPSSKVIKYVLRLGTVYFCCLVAIWLIYIIIGHQSGWHREGILPSSFLTTINLSLIRYQVVSPIFIHNHIYSQGQWWFLPISFLLKEPLIFLVAFILGLIFILYKYALKPFESDLIIFCLFPALAFASLASDSKLNLGIRYLFIAYPFLFIIAGFAVSSISVKLKNTSFLLGSIALLYYLVNLAYFYPNYISYTNEFGGSKNNGYKVFSESNIDWGHGLIQLKKYTVKNHINHLQILYFGRADPSIYGFKPISAVQNGLGALRYSVQLRAMLTERHGQMAVSTTIADDIGLYKARYRINNIQPYKLIAGSILLYNLP